MKKYLLACAILFAASSFAHATAIVSNVSYTGNSITFTQTGDLSGYAQPGSTTTQFGIHYSGNLFDGIGFQQNHFAGRLFSDGEVAGGNTGDFGLAVDYTWMGFSGKNFSASPITISWTKHMLNTAGTGRFEFFWGGGFLGPRGFTVINSVDVVNGKVQNQKTEIPEPATVALLGLAMAGAGIVRRRNRRA